MLSAHLHLGGAAPSLILLCRYSVHDILAMIVMPCYYAMLVVRGCQLASAQLTPSNKMSIIPQPKRD